MVKTYVNVSEPHTRNVNVSEPHSGKDLCECERASLPHLARYARGIVDSVRLS